ncbi:hypothetical protein Bca52824_030157 [Brassica carinata]|uniref:NET domain-containing protein n=1 Tax=Brassica carinata TaxID=52824 RepID=A0A8X7V6G5_BRACI|nr:hypothetical protein Bca52824_030157 [Brassica carinata]
MNFIHSTLVCPNQTESFRIVYQIIFLAVVGAEAVGGEVGADAVGLGTCGGEKEWVSFVAVGFRRSGWCWRISGEDGNNNTATARDRSEDDVKNLLSNPDIVKKLTSQYSNILFHELEDMQQQLESLLDDVVATCRPMTRGEKRDLQKAVMELPGGNRDRIAGIVEEHCRTSGKDFSDEVIANLDQSEDNVMLWRLHFYIGAVENAQKLAS